MHSEGCAAPGNGFGLRSGADARRESTAAVRLLRGLLTAGFAPEYALQILNSVYLLRDDGAFATVDLLEIDLASAALTLYKWGSAPSYLKRGASVQKIGTAKTAPICCILAQNQWWNRRIPVNAIATPFLLQQSITKSSRIEPPG